MLLLQMGTIIPSRQNSPIVHIALVIIVCIALIIVLRYFYLNFKKYLQEKKKTLPQKKIDISLLNSTAKRLGLTKSEILFLGDQCKKNNIIKLPLILETDYCIKSPFKKIFLHICENVNKVSEEELENTKLYFFMIIHKLENAKKNLSLLTSTIAFPENTPISYITKNGIHNPSSIRENVEEGLVLLVAQNSNRNSIKPEPLSKITLYLELKGEIAYQAETRVVRYQMRNDVEELVVTHTNNIKFFQRRKYRRIDTSLSCKFKAIKIGKDTVSGEKKYLPQEREYRGNIIDISAGGCRLKTNLPIHANQYIQIELSLSEYYTDTMIGVIVRSGKDSEKKWCILNIRFVRMSKKTRNNIFSLAYNYNYIHQIKDTI